MKLVKMKLVCIKQFSLIFYNYTLPNVFFVFVESMIGDTNIFLIDKDNCIGEIEIMIAEKSARGKKFGWEAVILMMLYGIKYIHLKIIEAKISITNDISVRMFYKLGFVEKSRSEIFKEITLEKIVDAEWLNWLQNQVTYELQSY